MTGVESPIKITEEGFNEGKERQMVGRLSREELEDKYLRMHEENQELKKYSRKQEEKIKRMATKLLRLVADKKRAESVNDAAPKQNVEVREMMEDFQDKIRELEKQNDQLRNKLTVAKSQLETHGKRQTPYDHVKSRINTGIATRNRTASAGNQKFKKNLRVQGASPRPGSKVPPPLLPQPRYGHSLLEEARLEKQELEDIITSLEEKIRFLEDDKIQLHNEIEQKEIAHQEDLINLREQLSGAQRSTIQENVDLIKVQRDVKDKATKLSALQAKYINLDETLTKVKASHAQLLEEMDKVNAQLKEEKAKNTLLQSDLSDGNHVAKQLLEYQHQIEDIKAENEILKSAHDKLVNSAFDVEREQQHRSAVKQLQVEIAQLQATIRSDLEEKNDLLGKITSEKENKDSIEKELSDLRLSYFTLKEQHDDLTEKMKFFTKESAVDFQEIEEALVLIKRRKEQGSQDLDFLERFDEEKGKDVSRKLHDLHASHADTVNELEKTRNMLILQHKINKDYQMEVDRLTKKLTEEKREYDLKLKEYAELLDIRADRIKKLECQMKDVAYGTRQYKVQATEESDLEEIDSTIELERGQNLFEIHMEKVVISNAGLKEIDEGEPAVFLTWEFYEYELQATPVVKGTRPVFNSTSQYVVKVDDFFLHFLHKETTLVELHCSYGTDYKTVAACQISFRDLLEKSHGRLHSTAKLIGAIGSCDGLEFATLEYWIRLRVPMDQAIRLYRERTKAMGYMSSKDYQALEAAGQLKQAPSDVNELQITILRCSGLRPSKQGVQPSPYAVYKFYDFADHDTEIVTSSNSPEFNDAKVFPVPMSEELDEYLRAESLEVFVFDDNELEPTAYIGVAKIPLITLANDKPIRGTFELMSASNKRRGTVDVSFQWKYTYLPASATVRTIPKAVPRTKRSGSVKQDDEAMAPSVAEAPSVLVAPVEASTPKHKEPPTSFPPTTSEPPIAEPRTPTAKVRSKPPVPRKTPAKPKEEEPTARRELEKPGAEMSVDELIAAAEDTPETPVEEEISKEEFSHQDEETPTPTPAEASEELSSEGDRADEQLVAEEMARTAEKADDQDTMFEDDFDDSTDSEIGEEVDLPVSVEVESPEKDGNVSEASNQTSDSEGLVVAAGSVSKQSMADTMPTVTVVVSSLMFHPDAPVLEDDSVNQIFVAYKFLDCDPADLETPMALPKAAANRPMHYNFKRVFHIDEIKRNYLLHMLMPDHPTRGRLIFTVVSEPEDAEGDCADVGYADVDIMQLATEGVDLIDTDIPVYSVTDAEEPIASLTVTVEVMQALRILYDH